MKTCAFLKACSILLLIVVLPRAITATETVVEVASGRTFRGHLLNATNSERLWLKTQKAGVSITRPIDWNRVVAVTIGDERFSPDSLKVRIAEPEWQWPDRPEVDNRSTWRSTTGRVEIGPSKPRHFVAESSNNANAGADIDIQSPPDLKIACIRIDASVENWNFDTAVDGIRLNLLAYNQAGEVVPAGGTVQAELIGQGPSNGMSGNPFPVLDQWSEVLQANGTNRYQHVLRLPFRGLHPEFAHPHQVGSFGMVHVKLTVAGQGTFEDTAAFTRIRPYSPVRDRLEQYRGRRFHPLETASPEIW